MKVELTVRHQGYRDGEVVDIKEDRARLWIGMGVAKKHVPFKQRTLENKINKSTLLNK